MLRKFEFAPDEFYHLYSRGTERRKLFEDDSDRQRFLLLLYVANTSQVFHLSDYQRRELVDLWDLERKDTLIDIGAYCLMPNHFHLLVKEKKEGRISTMMKKILTGYSMYFNKKYQRTGSLFESRFKASHASNDRYLSYLFSYIHLNPVKLIDSTWRENGLRDHPEAKKYLASYLYSSYLDYCGVSRREGKILNRSAFPDYFSTVQDFKSLTDRWLDFKEENLTKDRP